MNPFDSLPVIAEISLGLAGFTAVVAVLRRPDDLVSALFLLGYSSATLILALIPFLFTAMGSESAIVWRLSSSVMLLFSLAGFASYPKVRAVFPQPMSNRSIAITLAAALNAVLQLANAAGALFFNKVDKARNFPSKLKSCNWLLR